VFHITAYNSQVDKILDVRLVQPGERKTFDGREWDSTHVFTIVILYNSFLQVLKLGRRPSVSCIGRTLSLVIPGDSTLLRQLMLNNLENVA